MSEPPQPDPTVDAVPEDLLDAGLAALFGPGQPPSSGRLREPEPAVPEVPAGVAGRYEVLGELGRGGMGAVLQGRDRDLQRDVALKVLLEAHQGKAELRQRFVEEAQIAGQLQHPGVAPVYQLGAFPDGRPFFSMKLVKGRTLAALLAGRTDPAKDLPRLLGIFLQVCQTLAYAHARRVIHRDLKPQNVMVGAFGEVQVMDWGLAKVLGDPASRGRQPAEGVSVIRTERSAGPDTPASSQTQAGSVLGTPAYMAPEQARGEVELVDARADVFGLGALLCEILTGKPPFPGPTPEATRKAQAAKLEDAHARLDGSGADAELVGLARRCLAAEPWDRPRDAAEVAGEVTAYQESVAQRLRQAELARAAEAARAEEAKATAEQERQARAQAQARAAIERRARKLTVALAASVLLTGLLGSGAWLWLAHEQAERERQELERQAQVSAEIHTALQRAATLRAQAAADPGKGAEARALAQRALALTETAGVAPDLAGRVRGLLAALEEEENDRRLLASVDAARLRQAELNVSQSRFADERALPDYAAAFRAYGLAVGETRPAQAAARVRSRPPALRDHLIAALDDWARLAALHAAPERDWLRRVVAAADSDPWRGRLRAARDARDRPTLEQLAREVDVAVQPPAACVSLAKAFAHAKAREAAVVPPGRKATQAESRFGDVPGHEAAVALLRRVQQRHPGDFWVNHELGDQLLRLKQPAEAVRFLTAATALHPDSPGTCLNLGIALQEQGNRAGAMAAYRRAIELQPRYSIAHSNLGNVLHIDGKLDEAIREFRTAIRLNPKLASPHSNLANTLLAKGQLEEAIRECRTAIALDPGYAGPHANLALGLSIKKEVDEAIREYRAAIALDPRAAKWHHNLGTLLDEKGDQEGAITEYRAAIALDPKYPYPHFALGLALLQQGRLVEARQATRRNRELLPSGHHLRPQAQKLLSEIEQALDKKLTAICKGQAKPADDGERLRLAEVCREPTRKLYAVAARLYAEAFAHDAGLADDVKAQHRYHAACAAARAGAGEGQDDPAPNAAARAELRQRARDWLRDDLAVYAQLCDADAKAHGLVRQRLQQWQSDPDLASLRDETALVKLTDEERQACGRLWAEVEALLEKIHAAE
jgi:serine/threonine-protein kinase